MEYMRYCYISRNYKDITSAGNKAKTDIETTMQRMGFVNIGLAHTVGRGALRHFFRNLFGIVKAMCQVRKGDVLVLQYPLKKYYEAMCNVAHWKGAKVITQIHDLNSFRSKRLTPKQEMARLGHSDVVIAHNETMKAWLEAQGCPAKLTTLGIFDYLSPEPIMSILPDSAQLSPFIVTLAKPSPSFRPIKFLSSVPVPISVRVFPLEFVEITSPMRVEPVSSNSVLI